MSAFETTHLLTPEELELIRTQMGLVKFEVILSPQWASEVPTHRQQIREHVLALSDMELKHNRDMLANLGEAPDLSQLSISISHCWGFGGYAFTARPAQIGFDIEESARLSPLIVRRICEDQSEMDEAPDSAHLWVAKESAFKALLGNHQPAVLSDVLISNWQQLKDIKGFSFDAKPLEQNSWLKGISLTRGEYHLGFSTFSPTLNQSGQG